MSQVFLALNFAICSFLMLLPVLNGRLQIRFYVGAVAMLLFVLPAIVIEVINILSHEIQSPLYSSLVDSVKYLPLNAMCFLGLLGLSLGLLFPLVPQVEVEFRKAKLFFLQPKFMILVLVFVSGFALYKFSTGFGNIYEASYYAGLVRSGTFKDSWDGQTGFLFYKRFIFLALLVLILSPMYFRKTLSFYVFNIIVFVAYFSFLIYLNLGRTAILDLVLIFLFGMILLRKVGFSSLLLFGIAGFVGLILLDSVFNSAMTGELNIALEVDILTWLVQEFGNAYLSLGIAWNYDGSMVLFTDYFYSIFGNFLPVYSDWVTRETTYINSRLFGCEDCSYPTGLFAYGLFNLSVFGVLAYSFLVGVFLNFIDRVGRSIVSLTPGAVFVYAYLIVNSAVILRTGAPRFYFYDPVNISLVIFALIALKFRFKFYRKS